jgi:hypothetical protein
VCGLVCVRYVSDGVRTWWCMVCSGRRYSGVDVYIHVVVHVRDSSDLKNKCICPDGFYGLFLTCK